MQKRGQVETAKLALGLIIVGVVILIFIGVYFRVSKIFEKQDEKIAKENFDKVTATVTEFIQEDADFDSRLIAYHLPEDYVVVGYPPGSFPYPVKVGFGINAQAYAPSVCASGSCICIYKNPVADVKIFGPNIAYTFNDNEKKDTNLIKCVKFPGNVMFLAELEKDRVGFFVGAPVQINDLPTPLYNSGDYESFILHPGETRLDGNTDDLWKTRALYLEKFKDAKNGRIYIYFGLEDRSKLVESLIKLDQKARE